MTDLFDFNNVFQEAVWDYDVGDVCYNLLDLVAGKVMYPLSGFYQIFWDSCGYNCVEGLS